MLSTTRDIALISEPNPNRSVSSAYPRNGKISKPSRRAPQLILQANDMNVSSNLTSAAYPSNQTTAAATRLTERPILRPIAAERTMTPAQAASNDRPYIPPNRPNLKVVQPRKDVRNEINHPNKLQNIPNTVMGMFVNPTAGPRGKFFLYLNKFTKKNSTFTVFTIGRINCELSYVYIRSKKIRACTYRGFVKFTWLISAHKDLLEISSQCVKYLTQVCSNFLHRLRNRRLRMNLQDLDCRLSIENMIIRFLVILIKGCKRAKNGMPGNSMTRRCVREERKKALRTQ